MNLRDEIAKAAAQFDQSTEGKWHGHQMADALMPIVREAVREGVEQVTMFASVDHIVRRVCGE